MKKDMVFPLKEIINFEGNRYELAKACFKRVYSLLIEKQKEEKLKISSKKDDMPILTTYETLPSKGENIEIEQKITGLAMSDILTGKIKYYTEKDESSGE